MFANPTTSLIKRCAAAFVASSVLFASPVFTGGALAADMLEDGSYGETTPVEYGTGWYLRGEIGVSHNGMKRLGETSQPIGGGLDQEVEQVDDNAVWGYGVAIGKNFGSGLRGDIGVEHLAKGQLSTIRPLQGGGRSPCSPAFLIQNDGFGGTFYLPNHTIDNCIEEDSSSFNIVGATANVTYDFKRSFGGLRPFIGGGLGLYRNTFSASFGDTTCQPTEFERCIPTDGGTTGDGERYTQQGSRVEGTSYHLGVSASAGLSYAVSENLFFDTSYEYTKVLDEPLWGGISGVGPAQIPTDFHAVKLGLRYEIW